MSREHSNCISFDRYVRRASFHGVIATVITLMIPLLAAAAKVIPIRPDEVTVLMGSDAALTGALTVANPEVDYKRFWVTNWKRGDESFTWTLTVPQAGQYHVTMIISSGSKVAAADGDTAAELVLSTGEQRLTHRIPRTSDWDRRAFDGVLSLSAGMNRLTLQAVRTLPNTTLSLFALEFTRTTQRDGLQQRADALRASTDWMRQAKYGVMFHWTAQTKPRHGKPKPYADAVRDFDAEAFATMVKRTGAGFVVFTTSWADYYFPGPVKAIDEVLPGRTAQRDLISDLADSLGRHGIKLMLYYHPGHDDVPWWSKTGYDNQDKSQFFDLWSKIINEIGRRYGTKLAGFWFDDGIVCYYPYQAPWHKMTRAAKAGHPQRVIGYNSWILPKATEFQDFSCGEFDFTPSYFIRDGFLIEGGDGHYTGGPHAGLQACITTQLEPGNWCHLELDKEIPPPRYTEDELLARLQRCIRYGIVPMINLEVYQDGTASPASVALLERTRQALDSGKQAPPEAADHPPVANLEPAGTIILEAADAKLSTPTPVYSGAGDYIGGWGSPKGFASWSFVAPKSGQYTVIVTSAQGEAPSEYMVSVNDQILTHPITNTNWYEFVQDVLGNVALEKGKQVEVILKATKFPKSGALMNLRSVALRPVEKASNGSND